MEQSFLKNSLLLNSLKSSLSAAVQPEKLDEMLAFYNTKISKSVFLKAMPALLKQNFLKNHADF